jgi:exodeoxyribonuclease III
VAILSRVGEPLEIRRALPGDEADEQARYLEAAVEGIVVACIYLPNGNPQPGPKFQYKLDWFARLHAHAKSLWASGHPVALAGDFNVIPTELDVYNPKSWQRDALFRPESRQAYAELLSQGWLDSLRHLHPDERIYTFWDYFRDHWPRNAGLRIDHILLNHELAPRLKAAGVDSWVRGEAHASDHAPTWVELAAMGEKPVVKKSVARRTVKTAQGPQAKKTPGTA